MPTIFISSDRHGLPQGPIFQITWKLLKRIITDELLQAPSPSQTGSKRLIARLTWALIFRTVLCSANSVGKFFIYFSPSLQSIFTFRSYPKSLEIPDRIENEINKFGGNRKLMNRRSFLIRSSSLFAGAGLAGGLWHRRWKYIVIHHSAGSFGNITFLQKVHDERQPNDPIKAIPYHYIIGNGNGLKMGEVASDWRNSYSIWGTHVSANNIDRNFRGIGICLIGNFQKGSVPARQYDALVTLTKSLMEKYDILPGNVAGHGQIPGEATKCPGKYFPMTTFLDDITETDS